MAASMLSFTTVKAQALQGRISNGNPIQAEDDEIHMQLRPTQTPEQIEQARQEQRRVEQERMERKAAKEARKREKQAAKEQRKAEKAAQKAKKD